MKRLIVFVLLILLVGAGAYYWWQHGIAAVDPSDQSQKTFVIRKGQGTREIADGLKDTGLIRDPVVFYLLIKQLGVENKIQAGVFYLSASMTPEKILQELQNGRFDIAVTIPEGKRAEEIADILEDNFEHFDESWREKLNENEGYLFPDTYYFPRDISIEQIIAVMRDTFDKKFAQVTNNTSLSSEEIVVLASLIEREARHAQDRELVSSVIHNRLKEGMKLDIDASVQYAVGYDSQENRWWKQGLTADDLKIDSPYNTYTNAGLPPGPISNPGLASLIAAANPADTDYIFYLSDKDGNNHYARTLSEHNKNIDKYLQ